MMEEDKKQENIDTKTKITSFEMDALKETANIGTGNASIALSNIFKRKVNISLPDLKLSNTSEVSALLAGPKEMVVGIYTRIRDGMAGNIMMVMPIKTSYDIIKTFFPDKKKDMERLDDDDKALLNKIGTAIYSSYLTSLAKFFEKKITFDPPKVVSTFGESILDFVLLHVDTKEDVIVIKLSFDIEDTDIKGEFILLFTMESLIPLISNIRAKIST